MVHRMDVEFPVEGGVTLRGWLFLPDGGTASGHQHGAGLRRDEGTRPGAVRSPIRRRGVCGAGARLPRLRVQRTVRRASTSTHGSRSPIGAGLFLSLRTIRWWIRTGSNMSHAGITGMRCAADDIITVGARMTHAASSEMLSN